MLYQMEMLRSCIESGVEFDRVFILTGQDYPLRSISEIHKMLREDQQKEWIWGTNITTWEGEDGRKNRNKVVLYHFMDIKVKNHFVARVLRGASRELLRILSFRKKPYLVIDGKRWDIWHASGYMCITMQLAKYIYKTMDEQEMIGKYFRTSYVPEEQVIPTIVFNSPFASKCTKIIKEYLDLVDLSAVTYFNYGKAIQVFDETNYDELMMSGRMFARKFSSTKSAGLMKKLSNRN